MPERVLTRVGMLLAAVFIAVALLGAGSALGGTKKPSTTQILSCCSKSSSGKYGVVATLAPKHPNEKMKFVLFKKQNGEFVKVASKAKLPDSNQNGQSLYTAQIGPAQGTTCKMVAKFPGDEDHQASKDSLKFACKTGQPS